MKSLKAATSVLALMIAAGAPNIRAQGDVKSETTTFANTAKVSGSIGVLRAFQAIIDGNPTHLISALTSKPNPVNESLTVRVNGNDLKIRLIHVAVLSKDPILLGLLNQFDARVGAKDSLGRSAVHYASFGAPDVLSNIFPFKPNIDSDKAETILALLSALSANLESTDRLLRTPLHYAALNGDNIVVAKLLESSVSPDPIDAFGYTPLQLAARSGFHYSTVKLLRDFGATSKMHTLDFVIGIKNRLSSYAIMHPFITVLGAAGSLVGITVGLMSHLIPGSATTYKAGHDNDSKDDEGDSEGPVLTQPVFTPARIALIPGAGSTVSALPLVPSLGPTPKTKPKTKSKSTTFIKERTQEPLVKHEPRKLSVLRDLEAATKGINLARKSQANSQMLEAIELGSKLLAEVERKELDQDESTKRRHLVAAVNTILKTTGCSAAVHQKAQSFLERYQKYRVYR